VRLFLFDFGFLGLDVVEQALHVCSHPEVAHFVDQAYSLARVVQRSLQLVERRGSVSVFSVAAPDALQDLPFGHCFRIFALHIHLHLHHLCGVSLVHLSYFSILIVVIFVVRIRKI